MVCNSREDKLASLLCSNNHITEHFLSVDLGYGAFESQNKI